MDLMVVRGRVGGKLDEVAGESELRSVGELDRGHRLGRGDQLGAVTAETGGLVGNQAAAGLVDRFP